MDFTKCTGTLLALSTLGGCVADDADPETAIASQEISSFAPAWIGTTDNFAGFDTGWSVSTSTCVLSGVEGNLSYGEEFTAHGIRSTAGVTPNASGRWQVFAHGGAYDNGGHAHAYGNPVGAGVTCVPYPVSAGASWVSQPEMYGVSPPVKIASLATNRRCFLTRVISGSFNRWEDGVWVRQIQAGQTDATHPTTGWYVEGSLVIPQFSAGMHHVAEAKCIDFPSIALEFTGAFGGATNTMTTGNGVKMCGLTGIHGAFNVSSYSNGVTLNSPATQTGNWTMTVSANKFGEADCIQ